MVLQAFIDDSIDGTRSKVFCLGGYIAPAENWVPFSKEWKETLEGWKMPAYKFSRQDRPSHTEIDASFYRIIERHNIPASVDVVIDLPLWNNVVDKIPWPRRDGRGTELERLVRRPYFIATKMLMWGLYSGAAALNLNGPIDLIYDEQIECKEVLLSGWDYFKHTASPEMKAVIGATPTFEADDQLPPIQAADLVIGHIRQYEEKGVNSIGQDPFPWNAEKQIKRLAIRPTEEKLTKEITWMCDQENFEQLKEFLSTE